MRCNTQIEMYFLQRHVKGIMSLRCLTTNVTFCREKNVVEQVEYVSKLRNSSVGMLISSVYISKFFYLSVSLRYKLKHAKKKMENT